MNELRHTIINMLKSKFDILVTDTPINNEDEKSHFLFPHLLFKEYRTEDYTHFYVIDYDKYVNYRKEIIQTFDDFDINGYYLVDDNGNSIQIKEYDKNVGAIETFKPIKNLLEYNSRLYISENNKVENKDKKDFIYVYSAYNYANTMNKNTVVHYNRVNIDIFLYNDDNNEKMEYYCDIIHELFERDFIIYDKNNKDVDIAYIQTQLSFNMTEYNISNKVIRGSMLIRTYKTK